MHVRYTLKHPSLPRYIGHGEELPRDCSDFYWISDPFQAAMWDSADAPDLLLLKESFRCGSIVKITLTIT